MEQHLALLTSEVLGLSASASGELFFVENLSPNVQTRNSGATAVIEGVGDHGCEYMTGGRAIILGRTGRNFAAGMSGGIAYVLDKENNFAMQCNKAMVDLDPVELEEDKDWLRKTVEDFTLTTGSEVGKQLLDDWSESVTKFVKVFPHEYRRALQELEEEAENKNRNQPVSLLDPKVDLDIRAAYAIDNTPAVPGMVTKVVLPLEQGETDSEEDEEDSPGGSKPQKSPMSPPIRSFIPPIKVFETETKLSTTNGVVNGMNGARDIEDSIADLAMKKKKRETLLDKTRGFVKYRRETKLYRDPEKRQEDWEEIFDFTGVSFAQIDCIFNFSPTGSKGPQDAGCAMYGLWGSILPLHLPRLPPWQHHPQVQRPCLQERLEGGVEATDTDKQLSGVHRSCLSGTLRGRLRAGHQ